MGRRAWRDFTPPDDGAWHDMVPHEPGFDHAYAMDTTPLEERASRLDDEPPACGVFFGAQVGWDRGREEGTARRCDVCGNALVGERIICAGCLQPGDPGLAVRLAGVPYVVGYDPT